MKTQHAYNKITLEFGDNIVVLRPSLRAALFLENLHGGFPALLRKLAEFDTRTVWHIIKETAGKTESDDLFGYAADKSLSSFADAAHAPLFRLVAALLPEAPEAEIETTTSAPVAWSDAFRELFKIATGWLGWSPEVAWNATPQEITDAFEAHISKLKALNGSGDSKETPTNEDQRAQNVALGLDPEFDRAGLHALKKLSMQREGQLA